MAAMLAEFARQRALANFRRCGDAHEAPAKRVFLRRSVFWSDVQEWADGLTTLKAIRARRRARREDSPVDARGALFFLWGMVVIWLICTAMAFVTSMPRAHAAEADGPRIESGARAAASRSAWFHGLKQPDTGASCCDISDCRRTRAEWRGTGWLAEVAMPDGTRKWMPVPAAKVLKQPHSIDGEAYLCQSAGYLAGPSYSPGIGEVMRSASDPVIYCFVPPDMGS